MVFYASGTDIQKQLTQDALAVCDFPFDKLMPSLQNEGRSSIRVDWEDLSRYAASDGKGHDHIHEGAATAHPVERVVEGRRRVLGLFYLPPYTRIVLDLSLVQWPELAKEVLLAEAAHAVDYHYMSSDMRRAFTNSVHTEQLSPFTPTDDGVPFHLDGHTCSWFDVGAYADWVGEAFMEGFIEAYAPSIPVTISLNHPVGPEDRLVIRRALTPELEPEEVEAPAQPEPSFPEPTVEPAPAPPRDDEHDVYALSSGETYHDKHKGIARERTFPGATEAQAAGYRPCRVCKPGR